MEEKVLIRSQLSGLGKILLFLSYLVCICGFMMGYGVDFDECIPVLAVALIGITIFYKFFSSCSLVVTDKRVYGKAILGQRVDLPLDSISVVGLQMLGGITIATSAGKIKFMLIKNNEEIHNVISTLLIERQKNKKNPVQSTTSNVDELKKYKDLLDSDIITQEEFDTKKKQLLGL